MIYDTLSFKRISKPFTKFLTERGAVILQPTSEWELLRFETSREVSIIYRRQNECLTYTGEAEAALYAYEGGKAWDAGVRAARPAPHKKHKLVRALLARDGDTCFYCGKPMQDAETLEHIVPVAHGGPSHLSNLVLADKACNQEASHLSAIEKIKARDRKLTGGAE